MQLFTCPAAAEVSSRAIPQIETPLGALTLVAKIGDFELPSVPTDAWRREDVRGFGWNADRLRIELLVYRFAPLLPEHMQITDSWAAVWRYRAGHSPQEAEGAATRRGRLRFRRERGQEQLVRLGCAWEPAYLWEEWDSGSGQYLEALQWWNEHTWLAIGTGDMEYYARWSGRVPWLPSGIEYTLPRDLKTFDFEYPTRQPTELTITFPAKPHQLWQVHFLIAWVTDPRRNLLTDTEGDVTPWYAVEQDPDVFLAAAGCS